MTSFRIVTTILLLHSKYGINLTQSFAPTLIGHHHHHHTILSAVKGKKKLSASEKRKRRGKKLAPKVPKMEPHGLPRPDVWDKTTESSSTNANSDDPSSSSSDGGGDAIKAQAKSLIDVQRKSVATLTHVKNSIDALPPRSTLQAALSSTSDDDGGDDGIYHIVIDNFLNDDALCSEMAKEGRSMLDAMELDLESGGICGGQFGTAIVGGKEQYVQCPRCVEYVVSLTRHLPASLYDEDEEEDDLLGFRLDSAASMAGIRTFDRNARASALQLLNVEEDEDTNPVRPFDYVVDGKTPDDRRKVTALYFMVPDDWNAECGGGMRIKTDDGTEVLIEAKRDRLLIFRSDKCLHRMEGWVGSEGEGLDVGSHIKTHFVQS